MREPLLIADPLQKLSFEGLNRQQRIAFQRQNKHEKIDVKHYLMADAYFTWWGCGRSYLWRIVDMLHMGYVDEVLFGYEVVEQLPRIVQEWVTEYREREAAIS